MPLLLPEEARMIGKRAGSLSVFTKLAEFQKRGTTASPPCVSLLAEAAPLSFSFAQPAKVKRPRASPTPPTPLLPYFPWMLEPIHARCTNERRHKHDREGCSPDSGADLL